MKAHGYLEVIVGPMFSGKTEELIRQMKRASIAKKQILIVKLPLDKRYGIEKKLYSHAGLTIASEFVDCAEDILNLTTKQTDIVAIDEAQWFGDALIPVIEALLKQKKHILISGLGLTFEGKPFAPMPTLMAMADKISKLTAICSLCGEEAMFHKRTGKTKKGLNPQEADPSLVGQVESYQARCRNCQNK